MELLGRYQGSGLTDPPWLVRRPDGTLTQLDRLLHLVLVNVDGRRRFHEIAARMSRELGRGVSARNVAFLVERKLRPLGLIAGDEAEAPGPKDAVPVLALRFRRRLFPPAAVVKATSILRPLFLPPVVVAVLVGLAGLDLWLLRRGLAPTVGPMLSEPGSILVVVALLVVSGAFHELGHATACHYGGGRPGAIGFGLYLVWPAFYTDVTDSHALSRGGRLRTDLGGVYFNAVFMVVCGSAYLVTGFRPLLAFLLVQHVEVAYQFAPFVRLDGYHVVGDLAGVPDLFARVRPVLRSLVPGRSSDPAVRELTTRARVIVTAWVALAVPLLVANIVLLVVHAPQLIAESGGAILARGQEVVRSLGHGEPARAAVAALAAVMLAIPPVGITLTLAAAARVSARRLDLRRHRAHPGPWDGSASSRSPVPPASATPPRSPSSCHAAGRRTRRAVPGPLAP